ncbi:MAG: hypothetical protein WB819_12845 [Terriglobia bacterium]|jgi:hypothetical protein
MINKIAKDAFLNSQPPSRGRSGFYLPGMRLKIPAHAAAPFPQSRKGCFLVGFRDDTAVTLPGGG